MNEAHEKRMTNELSAIRGIVRKNKQKKREETSRRRGRQKRDEANTPGKIGRGNGGPVMGEATGQRFVLRRSKTAARTRAGKVREEAASFVGLGMRERVGWCMDSMTRLTKNQNHMMICGVIVVLVLICVILINLNRLAQKGLRVFEHHTNSKVAPFKLLSDILAEYSNSPTSWAGRIATILKRNSLWLDLLLRNSAQVIGPFIFRAFF